MNTQTTEISQLFQMALRKHQAGQLGAAEKLYRRILALQPQHRDSLHLLGAIRISEKRSKDAIILIERALALGTDVAAICFNLARAYEDEQRFDDALALYQRAQIKAPFDPDIPLGMGNVYVSLQDYDQALRAFDAVLKLAPKHADALNNRGLVYKNMGRAAEALTSYTQAITANSRHVDAHINRAALLESQHHYDEALAGYDHVLSLDPRHRVALTQRGRIYSRQKRHGDAIADFGKVLLAQPRALDVLLDLVSERGKICDWKDLDDNLQMLQRGLLGATQLLQPMTLARLLDSPEAMLSAAKTFSATKQDAHRQAMSIAPLKDRKIRIGYVTADFHPKHPVFQAIIGVLAEHDRTHFDIHYFVLPRSGPTVVPDVITKFNDHVHILDGLQDDAMLQVIRAEKLDIAIDLNGFTKFHRIGLFNAGIAPLQINFLGSPGTLGSTVHDYVIGDKELLPPDIFPWMAEQVVWMPHSFFPVDSTRPIAAEAPTRSAAGLPEAGFVFGCFSMPDRISPQTFSSWMNILKAVEGSVLWLKLPEGPTRVNIAKEAQRRGVAADRIVFAERTESNADHLARLSLMDLCLDTLPYNAHMTGLDALFSGVPLLTLRGKAFAGRVAASLLSACGLSELICETRKNYEQRAIQLATHPRELASLRDQLQQSRNSAPLFDTRMYTRDLERAYCNMIDMKLKGLPARHFLVS